MEVVEKGWCLRSLSGISLCYKEGPRTAGAPQIVCLRHTVNTIHIYIYTCTSANGYGSMGIFSSDRCHASSSVLAASNVTVLLLSDFQNEVDIRDHQLRPSSL